MNITTHMYTFFVVRLKCSIINYSNKMKKAKTVTQCTPESTVVCKCLYECKKLTVNRIITTRKQFASLLYKQQADYLLSRIFLSSIQRRRKKKEEIPESSRRQYSIRYTVPGEENLLQVCKQSFIRLFSLSNGRLQNLIEHTKKGEISFISNIEKNPNSHVHKIKYQEETRNSII